VACDLPHKTTGQYASDRQPHTQYRNPSNSNLLAQHHGHRPHLPPNTMEIEALVNHNDIHNSPSAERFYRLQLARQQRPHWHLKTHRAPELPREQKIRIRALREDAHMGYEAIRQVTSASIKQIQYALTTPLTPRTNRRGRKPSQFTDE
ncbi:hypothetical protein QBC40DRAFT_135399, partial [Triangularia verruculosa]